MAIEAFLKDEFLCIPRKVDNNVDFFSYVNLMFDEYIEKLNQLNTNGEYIEVVVKCGNVISALKRTLGEYSEGKPFQAYQTLKNILTDGDKHKYLIRKPVNVQTNLYRVRYNKYNFSLSKGQLFHVAFENRHNIATQRYSIPGFPCLYLSNSVYVCWEELHRPALSELQIVRFRPTKELNVISIDEPEISNGNSKIEGTDMTNFEAYLIIWPLIAACSIRVKYRDAPFKPEYIIPQLLLQWVRENEDKVAGICYKSTNVDTHKLTNTGKFYNFVFPVKACATKGYCNGLIEMFNMSDVISWPQIEAAQAHMPSDTKQTIPMYSINMEVKNIELSPNIKAAYKDTLFAKLEAQFISINQQPISLEFLES